MTLAAGFNFLFACPKRNKKDPGEGLLPLRRKQLCGSVVHSDLRCSFSMLSQDRLIFFIRWSGYFSSYCDLALTNLSVTTEEPQPDRLRRRRNSFDAPAYQTKDAGAAIPHVRDFPAEQVFSKFKSINVLSAWRSQRAYVLFCLPKKGPKKGPANPLHPG